MPKITHDVGAYAAYQQPCPFRALPSTRENGTWDVVLNIADVRRVIVDKQNILRRTTHYVSTGHRIARACGDCGGCLRRCTERWKNDARYRGRLGGCAKLRVSPGQPRARKHITEVTFCAESLPPHDRRRAISL
eukprot:3254774-Rhodomonas_salina.2